MRPSTKKKNNFMFPVRDQWIWILLALWSAHSLSFLTGRLRPQRNAQLSKLAISKRKPKRLQNRMEILATRSIGDPTRRANCFSIFFTLIEAVFREYLINSQQTKQEFKYWLAKNSKNENNEPSLRWNETFIRDIKILDWTARCAERLIGIYNAAVCLPVEGF